MSFCFSLGQSVSFVRTRDQLICTGIKIVDQPLKLCKPKEVTLPLWASVSSSQTRSNRPL